MSYYGRDRYKETFWHDDEGILRLGRIITLSVLTFLFITIPIGINGLIVHNHDLKIQINDVRSTTNPCLEFHSHDYVVIKNDYIDTCKNVMRYYLDELDFKPISPLTDDDVVLSIDGKLPTNMSFTEFSKTSK